MSTLDGPTLGERVAALRRRQGLSQRELATELGRSESWVSQVERDVLPVERVSVLQALADALGAATSDLRSDVSDMADHAPTPGATELTDLRLAMTGHPALDALLKNEEKSEPADLDALRDKVSEAWRLTHASEFSALAALIAPLLLEIEMAARAAKGRRHTLVTQLLTSAYQAAAAAFARQDEADAAWLAADRASRWAEDAGDPLAVVAAAFRMGHAFLTLRRIDQAEHVASRAIDALRPLTEREDCQPEVLSLYGAMHLLLAVVHAQEGKRAETRQTIGQARDIAALIGADRNDYNTEFGPTNVELHAVSVAVDLGDAGEALDLADAVDASGLSPERQSRLAIDVARAHVQRRHIGDAVTALLRAEEQAPEQVQTHALARETVRDLLGQAGRRATPELLDLARRIGATV